MAYILSAADTDHANSFAAQITGSGNFRSHYQIAPPAADKGRDHSQFYASRRRTVTPRLCSVRILLQPVQTVQLDAAKQMNSDSRARAKTL
jgi:hypothetical protein